jgi:hypothetical protein
MVDQANDQYGELPGVDRAAITPSAPNATLSLATATPQAAVVQESLSTLMNTGLSPYQMASQFAKVKENYLANTYGIIIE